VRKIHATATDEVLVASLVTDPVMGDGAVLTPLEVLIGNKQDFSDTPEVIEGFDDCRLLYIAKDGTPGYLPADFTYKRFEARKPDYAEVRQWLKSPAIGVLGLSTGEQVLFRIGSEKPMLPNPLARLLVEAEHPDAKISGPIVHLKGEACW
jgi:hypothetical protein